MNGKQKIYFLLLAIDDVRTMTPSGQPLIIDPTSHLNSKLTDQDLILIFNKLRKDLKVINILDIGDPFDQLWYIELLPTYDQYLEKVQLEPEYQDFTGRKVAYKQADQLAPITINDKAETISIPLYSDRSFERVWKVIKEIEEERVLGLVGEEVSISLPGGLVSSEEREFYFREKEEILSKLTALEAISGVSSVLGKIHFWTLKIGTRYQQVFEKYNNQYQKVLIDKNNKKKSTHQEVTPNNFEADPKQEVFQLEYSALTRKIKVNY